MWIVTNKSFMSVVQDKKNQNLFVVRARINGDLEEFLGPNAIVLETDDSDYRFRSFVHKDIFAKKMTEHINSIDYTNFKDSIKDLDRKTWYTKIWSIMFDVQESLYGFQNWWETYYETEKLSKFYKRK